MSCLLYPSTVQRIITTTNLTHLLRYPRHISLQPKHNTLPTQHILLPCIPIETPIAFSHKRACCVILRRTTKRLLVLHPFKASLAMYTIYSTILYIVHNSSTSTSLHLYPTQQLKQYKNLSASLPPYFLLQSVYN